MGTQVLPSTPARDVGCVDEKIEAQGSEAQGSEEQRPTVKVGEWGRAVFPSPPDVISRRFSDPTESNIDEIDHILKTRLHWAVSLQHHAYTEALLKNGADVNVRDGDGNTALHMACAHPDVKPIRLLIEYGADLGAKNVYGETSFGVAKHLGNFGAIVLLCKGQPPEFLRFFADAFFKSEDGVGMLLDASAAGSMELVTVILGEIETQGPLIADDLSLLMAAAEGGEVNLFKLVRPLPSCAASHISAEGLGPLHSAARGRNCDIFQELLGDESIPVGDFERLIAELTPVAYDERFVSERVLKRILDPARKPMRRVGGEVKPMRGTRLSVEGMERVIGKLGELRVDTDCVSSMRRLSDLGVMEWSSVGHDGSWSALCETLATRLFSQSVDYLLSQHETTVEQRCKVLEAVAKVTCETLYNKRNAGATEEARDMISWLLQQREETPFDVTQTWNTGGLLYHTAVTLADTDMTERLLSLGCKAVPFDLPCQLNLPRNLIQIYLERDWTARGSGLEVAVDHALDTGLFEALVAGGVDLSKTASMTLTPMQLAASAVHPRLIRFLLANGANVLHVSKGDNVFVRLMREHKVRAQENHSANDDALLECLTALCESIDVWIVPSSGLIAASLVYSAPSIRERALEIMLANGLADPANLNLVRDRSLLQEVAQMVASAETSEDRMCWIRCLSQLIRAGASLSLSLDFVGVQSNLMNDPEAMGVFCHLLMDAGFDLTNSALVPNMMLKESLYGVLRALFERGLDRTAMIADVPMAAYALRMSADMFDAYFAAEECPWMNPGTGETIFHAVVHRAFNESTVRHALASARAVSLRMQRVGTFTPMEASARGSNHVLTQLLSESAEGECSICGEREQLKALPTCGDLFCRGCLRQWCVQSRGETCLCPHSECSHKITLVTMQELLSADEFVARLDHLCEVACQRMEDFAWCPRCSHGGVVACSETECSACGHEWCGFCGGARHSESEECQAEQQFLLNTAYHKEHTRHCPHCAAPTNHTSGCTHVTCTHCSGHWCWACQGPYVGKYSMDPSRCPCKD